MMEEKKSALLSISSDLGTISELMNSGVDLPEYHTLSNKAYKIENNPKRYSLKTIIALRDEVEALKEALIDAHDHEENQKYLEWEYWQNAI